MGKLIIAIDIERRMPIKPIAGSYDDKGEYSYLFEEDLASVPAGTMISFDELYLKTDMENDSFIMAEFRGWEP